MGRRRFGILLAALTVCSAQGADSLVERAQTYSIDLIRIGSAVPPGNETRVAKYLKQAGSARPLLSMAHSGVAPADNSQWSGARIRDGYIYGRGAVDDKSLLAAGLAVLVELKRKRIPLARDVILPSEADEEAYPYSAAMAPIAAPTAMMNASPSRTSPLARACSWTLFSKRRLRPND